MADERSPIIRTLADRVRLERLRRRWTQHELAHRAGCAYVTISNLERGESPKGVTIDNLAAIARVLDVSTDYLIGRTAELVGSPT